MDIPATWPTPGNPATRVRLFRGNIERPMGGEITLSGHMNEAIEVGGKTFEAYRPDCQLQVGAGEAFADPELAPYAAVAFPALEAIFYILYTRKKTELEAQP